MFPETEYAGLERVTAKFNSLVLSYNFSRLGFIMKNQGIIAEKCGKKKAKN